MKINILNVTALRLCQSVTSKNPRHIFQGVQFRRDGTIIGSDGYILAHAKNACEWEGEDKRNSVVIKFDKPLPKNAVDRPHTAVIDIESGGYTGILHYSTPKGMGAIVVTVMDGQYPEHENAIGVGTPDVTMAVRRNLINPEYMVKVMKAVGGGYTNPWQFRKNGTIAYLQVDDDTEAIIVPLKMSESEARVLETHDQDGELEKAA